MVETDHIPKSNKELLPLQEFRELPYCITAPGLFTYTAMNWEVLSQIGYYVASELLINIVMSDNTSNLGLLFLHTIVAVGLNEMLADLYWG